MRTLLRDCDVVAEWTINKLNLGLKVTLQYMYIMDVEWSILQEISR